jgi:hypothetical protein
LSGVVTDPSGAVIPGAKVVLTDVNKAYDYPTTTDATGRYLITNLPPSTYRMTVQIQGFKSYTQTGIVLDVGTKLSLDARLELGTTTQAVEVTAARPVLETQDSVTGQEIGRTLADDLPLYGRNIANLTYLAPGVTQGIGATYGTSGGNDFVSNGLRNASAELLIDGVTVSTNCAETTCIDWMYQPSVDAVQEYKVMQNNFTAEEGGYSGNTYVNMVTRSGTNQLHGSVYEFFRNNDLNATNFFTNRAGGHNSHMSQNQYGVTMGGPIKKDKTFFFVDWEGTRSIGGGTYTAGVPTAAELTGNFGELCGGDGPHGPAPNATFNSSGICSNPKGQLWDPYSGIYEASAGGRMLQTPIPYNNIAAFQSAGNANLVGTPYQPAAVAGNLIDPVAAKMASYFPAPNYLLGTSSYTPYDNWTETGSSPGANDQFDVKIDHRFTDKTAFMGRFSLKQGTSNGFNCFGNLMDPCTVGPDLSNARSLALVLNHTFSPTTLLNVSLGFSRNLGFTEGIDKDYPNFNPVTTLGEPSYMTMTGILEMPSALISSGYSGVTGVTSIGSQTYAFWHQGEQAYEVIPILTKMKNHHELKMGAEWRENQMNWTQAADPGGAFTYTFNATSEYPSNQTLGGGDAMASFLMGNPYGGSGLYAIPAFLATQNYRWATFIQDNWRATSRLTLNLGLRWDLETPRTERHNRMSYFDPTETITPASGTFLVQAPNAINTATWPAALPYVPNDITTVVGGLAFPTAANRHINDYYDKSFGPRFGLAYKISNNLVWRSGWGWYYVPTRFATAGSGNLGNEGFSAKTSAMTTAGNDGSTPWGLLRNPYYADPAEGTTGLLTEHGSSMGGAVDIGASMQEAYYAMSDVAPTMQTWSGGFQYQLHNNWMIEANYVGTKGTHLYYYMEGQLQTLGRWVEAESSNPALATALNTKVANPYYGAITTPGCGICGSTISASSLMYPYPQFSGAWNNFPPIANSIYNALQISVTRRMANGLEVLLNYTNSKSIDDDSVGTNKLDSAFVEARNPNAPQAERSVSEWDIPQVFQAAYVWQLPFGKGKRWGGNWNSYVNGVLGGWQTNGMWRFDDGQPLSIGVSGNGLCPASYQCGFPNQTGNLLRNPKSEWLTNGYFSNASSVLQVTQNYVIGNAPREQSDIRGPGTSNASLSMFKEVPLNKMREGSRLQIRVEAFNALNHVQFKFPNETFNTSSFGTITGQANSPREVQLAAKILF